MPPPGSSPLMNLQPTRACLQASPPPPPSSCSQLLSVPAIKRSFPLHSSAWLPHPNTLDAIDGCEEAYPAWCRNDFRLEIDWIKALPGGTEADFVLISCVGTEENSGAVNPRRIAAKRCPVLQLSHHPHLDPTQAVSPEPHICCLNSARLHDITHSVEKSFKGMSSCASCPCLVHLNSVSSIRACI